MAMKKVKPPKSLSFVETREWKKAAAKTFAPCVGCGTDILSIQLLCTSCKFKPWTTLVER